MTWPTSIGNRVLEGNEKSFYLKLAQEALAILLLPDDNGISAQELGPTRDLMFDRATVNQKVTLLAAVVKVLTKEDARFPELHSVLEAAAYFPFAILHNSIERELEHHPAVFTERKRVHKLFLEYIAPVRAESDAFDAEQVDNIAFDDDLNADFPWESDDLHFWTLIIDGIADRIFWDRDWMLTTMMPALTEGVNSDKEIELHINTQLPAPTKARVSAAIAFLNKKFKSGIKTEDK